MKGLSCGGIIDSKMNQLTLGMLEEDCGDGISSVEVEIFQHDEELIAPPNLSRFLVITAHALLLTAGVSLWAAISGWTIMWGSCTLSFLVYLTSIMHWRRPRFDSLVRLGDILAVAASIAWGSIVAVQIGESTITNLWFGGMAVIGSVFTANEVKFYLQISRQRSRNLATDSSRSSLLTTLFPPTLPGTREREEVYRINVLVHGLFVHGGANALALAVILLGKPNI